MEYNQLTDEIICATPSRKENFLYGPKLLRNWACQVLRFLDSRCYE